MFFFQLFASGINNTSVGLEISDKKFILRKTE